LKTFVINNQEGTRVPFLRGILIRALLDAGMSFEDAYALATQVRDELADTEEIASDDLQKRVTRMLAESADIEIQQYYRAPVVTPSKIVVKSLSGTQSAFSRGRHQRYLQSSGVRQGKAEKITTKIFDQLLAAGATSITTCQLGYLTYICLRQELGKTEARQYLVWSEFQRSGRPLILMVCGAVGSGKSSIATEVAHRLEIVRTQSTDMLREVMRTMIPKKLLPILHRSSFDAWTTLSVEDKKSRDKSTLIAEGYRSQAELLALPCEAVMRRAIQESVPLILEGVHCHPNLLHRLPDDTDAIMVHVTLAVMKSGELKSRLRGRGVEVPHRRAKRYLNKFEAIWLLQSFLLSEAERCDTQIIPNDDLEAAVYQITGTVSSELSRHFSSSPAEVFTNDVEGLRQKHGDSAWQDLVPYLISTNTDVSSN
jgi:2-phosphoglycerate kinase